MKEKAYSSNHGADSMFVTPAVFPIDTGVDRCAHKPVAGVTFETRAGDLLPLLTALCILRTAAVPVLAHIGRCRRERSEWTVSTVVLSSLLLLRYSCMYLYRWFHLLHRRDNRYRYYFPCRRPSHGKSDSKQEHRLKHQKYMIKAMLVLFYNPKTKRVMRRSVPNWFSHCGPVQPSSQKHEPVPLGPSSHDPCSVQLQAWEKRK